MPVASGQGIGQDSPQGLGVHVLMNVTEACPYTLTHHHHCSPLLGRDIGWHKRIFHWTNATHREMTA